TGAHSFQGGFEATFAGTDQFNHGTPQTTRPAANLGTGNTPTPGINSTNFPGLSSNDFGAVQTLLNNLAGSVGSVAQQYFINSPADTEFLDYRDEFLFRKYYHQNDWAAFFKDNWRLSNDFTLNLGL